MKTLKSQWHWILLAVVVGLAILGTPAPDRPATIVQMGTVMALVFVGLSIAEWSEGASRSHCAVCHRSWAVFRGPRRDHSERRCWRHRIPLAERRATSRRLRGARR